VLERKLEEINAYVIKCLEPLKAQAADIKNRVQKDVKLYNNEIFGKINIVVKKLALENSSVMAENKILLAENFELKSKTNFDSAEFQAISSELKLKNSEIAKLRKELAKLKEIQDEFDAFKSSALQESGALRERCEELTLCLADIKPKFENAQAEIYRLSQKVLLYEQDSQSSHDAHISQQQNIVSYYDKLVNELRNDNMNLNLVIQSQQEQIEKLTNSLLGNKSHFAKFVELKSENINLQTKLSQITKKVNNGAILGTSSSFNSSLYSNGSVSSLSLLHSQVPKGDAQSSLGMPLQVPVSESGWQKTNSKSIKPMRQSIDGSSINDMINNGLHNIEGDANPGDTVKNRIMKRRQNNQNSDELSTNSYMGNCGGNSESDFNFECSDSEGGNMINLNLIDDSNSVCQQLAKVESFARTQAKKLIPRHDGVKIGKLLILKYIIFSNKIKFY
jgi:hypothetical protein